MVFVFLRESGDSTGRETAAARLRDIADTNLEQRQKCTMDEKRLNRKGEKMNDTSNVVNDAMEYCRSIDDDDELRALVTCANNVLSERQTNAIDKCLRYVGKWFRLKCGRVVFVQEAIDTARMVAIMSFADSGCVEVCKGQWEWRVLSESVEISKDEAAAEINVAIDTIRHLTKT